MADVPNSALPVAGTLTGVELIPAVQGGVTVRLQASQITAPVVSRVDQNDADITLLQTDMAQAQQDIADNAAATANVQAELTAFEEFPFTDHLYDMNISGQTVSKADCNTAMNALNLDRSRDQTMFVRDITGATRKHALVIYRANGDTNQAGTNYRFWVTMMDEAQ
jgi:hypothetical protein